MNAADPFTRADPLWRNAQRLGAHSGDAFEVHARRVLRHAWRLWTLLGFAMGFVVLVHIWDL